MAKKTISEASAEQVTPETHAEEIKPEKKAKQTSFTVYKEGNPVRTYSVERHGADAGDLAEEYAKKISGEVR